MKVSTKDKLTIFGVLAAIIMAAIFKDNEVVFTGIGIGIVSVVFVHVSYIAFTTWKNKEPMGSRLVWTLGAIFVLVAGLLGFLYE